MTKILTGLTVLLIHTAAAYAQQSPEPPPPPPQEYPPGYGPPPGYVQPGQPGGYGAPAPAPQQYGTPQYGAPPPPPQYYYAPPPPPPPPPRRVTDRPFTIGGGIGFGGIQFPDSLRGGQTSQGGFAYTARLGFGVGSRAILMWDLEGAVANHNAAVVAQTAHLAALQLFVTNRLFLKGGFGLAQFRERADGGSDFFSTWGGALMGGVGYELIQGWNWSFDVEATATGARYTGGTMDENWMNWSLVNFAVNFF